MPFQIQVSNPIAIRSSSQKVEDLSEAIETIFPMKTENALLVWNGYYIPINYKYDLSVLIDDLLPLLSELLTVNEGSYEVEWASDTFRADWRLDWADGHITIVAQWLDVLADLEGLRNHSTIEMDLELFLYEWKGLLRKVRDALRLVDIEVSDEESYSTLRWVESSIPKLGQLYQPSIWPSYVAETELAPVL